MSNLNQNLISETFGAKTLRVDSKTKKIKYFCDNCHKKAEVIVDRQYLCYKHFKEQQQKYYGNAEKGTQKYKEWRLNNQ